MKHSVKVTVLLLAMFLVAQFIGLFVISQYSPQVKEIVDQEGNATNVTSYNLPYGLDPPDDIEPRSTLISIVVAIIIAVSIMFLLMKIKAELILRVWFFVVVTIAIGITINSLIQFIPISELFALLVAFPLAFIKIFKRNIYVHNLTELIIYPGIATIFVPLLNIWTVVILLVIISIYDMYAVWHAGFMQKMAKYQIDKLKVFTGFFVPVVGKKDREKIRKVKQQMKNKKIKTKDKEITGKNIKVNLAILGGGDVVFPIILAGVVLRHLGLFPAIIVSLFATFALAFLFYISEKGKFYPAMPFISGGCFIGLILAYLV